jgi:hypothetical protein
MSCPTRDTTAKFLSAASAAEAACVHACEDAVESVRKLVFKSFELYSQCTVDARVRSWFSSKEEGIKVYQLLNSCSPSPLREHFDESYDKAHYLPQSFLSLMVSPSYNFHDRTFNHGNPRYSLHLGFIAIDAKPYLVEMCQTRGKRIFQYRAKPIQPGALDHYDDRVAIMFGNLTLSKPRTKESACFKLASPDLFFDEKGNATTHHDGRVFQLFRLN